MGDIGVGSVIVGYVEIGFNGSGWWYVQMDSEKLEMGIRWRDGWKRGKLDHDTLANCRDCSVRGTRVTGHHQRGSSGVGAPTPFLHPPMTT